MYLLILCVATPGCGNSAKPGADSETRAAPRKNEAPANTEEEGAVEEKADKDKVAKKKADDAAEKKADEDDAAANSYVKVNVDVELRGVLTCTEEPATISIGQKKDKRVWVLYLGEDKEMRAKAKALHGKTVLVQGIANLRGVISKTKKDFFGGRSGDYSTESFLDLEPAVAVKRLVAATKK
jgi:hypothetical protein